MWQVREQVGGDHQEQQDRESTDDAGDLAAGACLEGNSRPRAARAHGEPLEEPREDVCGADPHHLLVAVHGLLGPSGVCRGRRDRVGKGHQRDAEGADDEQADVPDRDQGQGEGWEALRQVTDDLHPLAGQVEVGRGADADDDGHEDGRHLRQGLLQDPHDDQGHDADAKRPEVGRPSEDLLDGRDDLADQPVGRDGEAAQLADLADEDREREPVHVADHRRFGQQVRDEPELGGTGRDHEDADEDRLGRGEDDGPHGVTVGRDQGEDRRGNHRAEGGVRAEDEDAGGAEHGIRNEAHDRRVEAGDRRQARELRVGHALRHEEGGEP